MAGIIIGIDASRNRSGGARGHLVGILKQAIPANYGIKEVHVWAYTALLDLLPDAPWLIKHNPKELEKSLISQLWWQYNDLPKEARKLGCDVLLNTDAGTVCNFHPSVVMSRDMLSYEKGEMARFGLSFQRLRLLLLKYVQANSMKRADGVVFLTKYAADTIQAFMGKIDHATVIPHGVSDDFRQKTAGGVWENIPQKEIKCIYVSNTDLYKHQWHVVKAIGQLRQSGQNISLLLVGGGAGKAQEMLEAELLKTDPDKKFIQQIAFIKHSKIPELIAQSDIFIFASSCENMPNTLVEGMASGLPIACSNRGPMPEVLADGGVYFDPEDPDSIFTAVNTIITDEKLRITIAQRAKTLSEQYSWARCAHETLTYLTKIALENKNKMNY